MWAAGDEAGRPELVSELVKLGVDVNATNKNGDSAMTWALRRGDTEIVNILRKAGARENDSRIKESVEKALALLQKSGPEFSKASGCVSCHNQSLPQMAIAGARRQGFSLDEQTSADQVKAVLGMYGSIREMMINEPDRVPDPAVSVSYALLGLAAERHTADATTDAMAGLIAKHQAPDGHFQVFAARPPIESSVFTATALSIRALQVYGKGFDDKIAQGRSWLKSAKPLTNEDSAMQLLGLAWSKAEAAVIANAAKALVAQQRPDGGWAQLPGLETDAYATGQVLFALETSGQLDPTQPAYRRGVEYLLRTQLKDGSWLVRSRAFPFQTYRDAGFPHGKDQFISAAGTSWAIMALTAGKPRTSE